METKSTTVEITLDLNPTWHPLLVQLKFVFMNTIMTISVREARLTSERSASAAQGSRLATFDERDDWVLPPSGQQISLRISTKWRGAVRQNSFTKGGTHENGFDWPF
jgi:hypothetical protein